MNILLIFFLLIETILSFRTNDFCFLDKSIQKQVVCTKQQCGFDLCSSDEQSCKQINDWYHISQKFISLMNIKKEIRTFYEFLQGIKDCKPREYVSIKQCLKNVVVKVISNLNVANLIAQTINIHVVKY